MSTKPIIVPCTQKGLEDFFEKPIGKITIIDLLLFNKLVIDYSPSGGSYWYQILKLEFKPQNLSMDIVTANIAGSIHAHENHNIDLSKDYRFIQLST